MTKELCMIVVVCLVVGFLLGRWKRKEYCGDVIVTEDAESCTFALDIPADDIPEYRELVFRVVKKTNRPENQGG